MIVGSVHGAMHSKKSPNFLPTPNSKTKKNNEDTGEGNSATYTNPHLPAGVTQNEWAGAGVVGTGTNRSSSQDDNPGDSDNSEDA